MFQMAGPVCPSRQPPAAGHRVDLHEIAFDRVIRRGLVAIGIHDEDGGNANVARETKHGAVAVVENFQRQNGPVPLGDIMPVTIACERVPRPQFHLVVCELELELRSARACAAA